MGKFEDRRAKVTPETKEEARKLRELWETRSHPSQTEFGEAYDIGNQSAVSQFLRGQAPLSLKAARGFALGLACEIADFSPRLAAEAAAIAASVPRDKLSTEVVELAAAVDQLPQGRARDWVLMTIREAMKIAHEMPPEHPPTPEADEVTPSRSTKRARSA